MNSLLRRAARPLELIVGAFFIFAALLKLQDPQLFAIQIHEYQILTDKAWLAPAALFFLTLEMLLGIALAAGLRLRTLTHAAVVLVLVFFTGVIAYAWWAHGIEDCGCMGEVKMGPGVSILKNLLLLLLVGWAWLGRVRAGETGSSGTADRLATALVVALATGAAVYPDLFRATSAEHGAPSEQAQSPAETNALTAHLTGPPEAAGPFGDFVVDAGAGETYDLGRDRYLVVMLSATCDHCLESVQTLFNDYPLWQGDLPPLVGLVYEPKAGDLATFQAMSGATFPLHSIGDHFIRFAKYIGQEPPRLHLVENARSVYFWDEAELPSAAELAAFLAAPPPLAPVDPGAQAVYGAAR